MNLKEKFIWNLTLVISSAILIWNMWIIIDKNSDANKFYQKYKIDSNEVGTDNEFGTQVAELEKKYRERDLMLFSISSDPADLNRVVMVDQISGKKRKNLWVSGIIKSRERYIAIINYKDKSFNVSKGDSVAGGIILDITSTIVTFEKNDQLYTFNRSVNNNSQ